MQLGKILGGVLEVQPGALGADLETAIGVRGPAVVALVPEVVWVSIVCGLRIVVSMAVEPDLSLERLREAPRLEVVCQGGAQRVSGDNDLQQQEIIELVTQYTFASKCLLKLTKQSQSGTETFCLVIWRTRK